MKKITLFAAAMALVLGSACTKDGGASSGSYSSVPAGEGRYAIVAKGTSSSTGDTSLVILTEASLESGSTTIINNGNDLGEKSPTEWTTSLDGRYLYSIQEAGGELPAEVIQYNLDSTTGLVLGNKEYNASAYHVWGMWGDDFVSARNTSLSTGGILDASNSTTYYSPCVSSVKYSANGGSTFLDSFSSVNYVGGNYSGAIESLSNGETANIVGFTTAGNYVYASYATSGVSRYAILDSAKSGWDESRNGAFVAKGGCSYECYYSTEAGVTTSSESTSSITSITNSWNNGSSFTEYVPYPLTPGNAYIARYDLNTDIDKQSPVIIATDQMGQAFGRTSGNPFNMVVANDDDSYVYVFSPGTTRRYTATAEGKASDNYVEEVAQYNYGSVGVASEQMSGDDATLSIQTTNKGAKVMRIKSGQTSFDDSFGTQDISIVDGGKEYVFSRVWHISGSKFLLRVIHTEGVFNVMHHNVRDPGDAYFFIYDAEQNRATKISGLPEPSLFVGQTQSSIGTPFVEGSKVYLPMAPSNKSYPLIYVIDSESASATEGIEVASSYVVSITKLTAM